ncbi:MAG: sporulation protein [Ruminococcaceae bacterium]|nr:sporulation protein [Oscillospiraceae bacterium]
MSGSSSKPILPTDIKTSGESHRISLLDRTQLQISGVCEVISFDEDAVMLRTVCGTMKIEGSAMHVSALNIDRGELILDGRVDGISYESDGIAKSGFWGRLFG